MSNLSQSRSRRKLHPVATPYVFAFYMSSIMALLMCFVITAANAGVTPDIWAMCSRLISWRCQWRFCVCWWSGRWWCDWWR